jgi:hypothetical protein
VASWIDAQRARCGPLTDGASIFATQLGVERDPPTGAAGLVVLAHAIKRQRGSQADEDERLFVELAGSYLALVLCDSLGRGEHAQNEGRHGLRFGQRDFFDPFAAIERTLEAPNVPKSLAHEVALAEALAKGEQPSDWLELKARVLPRLIGPRFFGELGSSAASVLTQSLAGEVSVAFIVREGGRGRYLQTRELPANVTPPRLRAAAVSNLALGSKAARLVRAETDCGPLVVARTGDGLDSSRVLLPGLYDLLARELGSPFAVALPHRDALFATRLCDAEFLAERTRDEAVHARHAISARVLVLEGPGRLRVM